MLAIKCRAIAISAILALFTTPSAARSPSVVLPTTDAGAARIVIRDPFAVGQSIIRPKTLEVGSLEELVGATAGNPRLNGFLKYGGDFDQYWEKAAPARAGKTFEAMLAHQLNSQRARTGSTERFSITAAEGEMGHPADLLRLAEDGTVIEQSQLKLGWRAGMEALDDPKYVGMSIITAQDSLQTIERELLKAKAKAARRGIPLAARWENVRDALSSGRLIRELPGGLPTRDAVFSLAERTAEQRWLKLADNAGIDFDAANSAVGLDRVAKLRLTGKLVGRAFFAVDVATTGVQTYADFQRFNRGEIEAGDLGVKLSLRGANVYLATITVFDPEPVTKVVAVVCLVVVVAVDTIHDRVIETRTVAARRLLEAIDRDERNQAVRGQLLDEVRHLVLGP